MRSRGTSKSLPTTEDRPVLATPHYVPNGLDQDDEAEDRPHAKLVPFTDASSSRSASRLDCSGQVLMHRKIEKHKARLPSLWETANRADNFGCYDNDVKAVLSAPPCAPTLEE